MAKNIIVSQIGARHRYTIPKTFYENNILKALFTDSYRYTFLGKLSYLFIRLGIKKTIFKRLCLRLPQIPQSYIKASDKPTLKLLLKKNVNTELLNEILYFTLDHFFCKHKKIINEADCIYNMYYENLGFIKYAKKQGKTVVVDIYENPISFNFLLNEVNKYPEYSCIRGIKKQYEDRIAIREKYVSQMLQTADYYTVPSKYVLKAMMAYPEFNPKKAFLLPYPTSIQETNYNYRPIKHKIIWVGNDPVRKGLIYCAKAATILKQKYTDLDFRIIGSIDNKYKDIAVFKDLNFIGTLTSSELKEEYRTAEAYVFPTLSEGFAGTVIEAASCGCPIITTECAGTDLEAFPAIYIPIQNVNAIVDSVTSILENSKYRDQLSLKTFQYSQALTPETYEKRLISIFKSI
ncbi:glycosyltransferase [Phocaeicola dorei]|uniref:Glycosyl transferase family 1 domain-containing protein n=4 Tax=Phocaeicola dorei TaxID=357276 RepID=B6W357_9BACT|nr:glycosyltransferase [Phocaeicola dorei]EEB23734.1 glycosyltransferase, group 1 family protein [Phocaeicola dorei DSM 17855]QJR76269.1 glycosyltransferase [Phocaeicola dorei]UWN81030.1 glycosyltransferase [Phocaeicola dorei]